MAPRPSSSPAKLIPEHFGFGDVVTVPGSGLFTIIRFTLEEAYGINGDKSFVFSRYDLTEYTIDVSQRKMNFSENARIAEDTLGPNWLNILQTSAVCQECHKKSTLSLYFLAPRQVMFWCVWCNSQRTNQIGKTK